MSKKSGVELDKSLIKGVVETDGLNALSEEVRKSYAIAYKTACELRELRLYKLLQSIVSGLNENALKTRTEKLRLVDEGDGLSLIHI
ncbi:MAG: hypothetical protein N2234_05270, partial [Planctomycetota bacterium]|nr:hypothetical protein [Planctomycetota bacterium]